MKVEIETVKAARQALRDAETAAKATTPPDVVAAARAAKRKAAKDLTAAEQSAYAAARAALNDDNAEAVVIELVIGLDWYDAAPSEARCETLRLALIAGVDFSTFEKLATAGRVGPYDHLSRGKGWCRQGKGADAVWGKRDGSGYRVGPGDWVVGSTDGLRRKSSTPWKVEHVQVGSDVCTIAN